MQAYMLAESKHVFEFKLMIPKVSQPSVGEFLRLKQSLGNLEVMIAIGVTMKMIFGRFYF